MLDIITGQRLDFEMLKTQFGNQFRWGPVEVVDPQKGYRVKWGEGEDGPFLSPWFPHPESGGQTATWLPLSVGQVVMSLHPNGDARQGYMIRGGFTDQNTQPSEDLAANVMEAFGIRMTMKDGTLTIEGNLVVKGEVDLGDEGGPRVARIGDKVNVKIGSSKGLWEIVEGSELVRAAG
ncbi:MULTISPECIES: baseplate assembly protein [unclassified Roseibium]|uniref:baseplate assembly protein n=1 Tax=unclassified Roseibium TaxID=2629323 RepID=UPI00274003B9|nr:MULTISPECIES: baseplate assembly protein [unclassified Roseibium]